MTQKLFGFEKTLLESYESVFVGDLTVMFYNAKLQKDFFSYILPPEADDVVPWITFNFEEAKITVGTKSGTNIELGLEVIAK